MGSEIADTVNDGVVVSTRLLSVFPYFTCLNFFWVAHELKLLS